MSRRPSPCLITGRASAPCCQCRRRDQLCHLYSEAGETKFYCGECCPEHGAPLLTPQKQTSSDPISKPGAPAR